MEYHAPTKKMVVDVEAFDFLALSILNAIRHMREMAGKPLEPYKGQVILDHVDHAGHNLLHAAKRLGIDMGAEWQDQLDLRDKV